MSERFPLGVYIDDDQPCRDNLPEETALVLSLRAAYRACEAALQAHDPDHCCDCCLCRDIRGVRYNLNSAESAVSCELRSVPDDEALSLPDAAPAEPPVKAMPVDPFYAQDARRQW